MIRVVLRARLQFVYHSIRVPRTYLAGRFQDTLARVHGPHHVSAGWGDLAAPENGNRRGDRRTACCRKSNVTELRSHEVSWRIQPRNWRYIASAIGKIRRNESANPIWAYSLSTSSALLITAVIRTVAVA